MLAFAISFFYLLEKMKNFLLWLSILFFSCQNKSSDDVKTTVNTDTAYNYKLPDEESAKDADPAKYPDTKSALPDTTSEQGISKPKAQHPKNNNAATTYPDTK